MKNVITFAFSCGDQVKCKITGFTGIVVCQTNWLNGCKRYAVQGKGTKDGNPNDAVHFDEQQLTLEKAQAVDMNQADTGGPFPAPMRSRDPRK